MSNNKKIAKFKDITNQRFGKLTAVKFSHSVKTQYFWVFICECGNETTINRNSAVSGRTTSCGCYQKEKVSKDITGMRSGSVVAVQRSRKHPTSRVWFWQCLCDCGNTFETITNRITQKQTTSCGCRINYSGYKHPNWKGGKQTKANGYTLVLVSGHPFAQKSGYIQEHRLVMEEKIGRYLLPNENVHHLNGNRSDNRIENLELWVKAQPGGQRAEDLVKFAREILETYGNLF